MKKNYFIKLLTTAILLFGISLLLINCEQVTTFLPPDHNSVKSDISINYVSIENISGLNTLFSSGTKSHSKTTAVIENFGTVSITNVLEVIDTLGNQNYSFRFFPKKPKPNSIFNLVVNTSNGNNTMAIVEYRMAPDFAQEYFNGTKSISEFTGSILKFPFSASSNVSSKAIGNTCVQNIDEIVNCDEVTVDGGLLVSSGGGSGAGSTRLGDTNTYTGSDGGSVTHNYGDGGGYVVWVCGDDGSTKWSSSQCNGVGHGGTWVITLSPSSHTRSKTGKSSTGNCCDGTDTTGSIGLNTRTIDLANSIRLTLRLSDTSPEGIWLYNTATTEQLTSIDEFLVKHNNSLEAKTEAIMRINVEMADGKWQASTGTFLNRPALEYTHKYAPSSGGGMMYLLKNGLVFYNTNSKKAINPSDFETIAGTAPSADGYNYIYSYETKRWYETPLPPATYADADIDFLFKGFWSVTKTAARYATPLEDAIILIDGNDLDGIEANRNVAGLMILVSIVPGGKLLKPVGRIAKGSKSWQIASKIGNKTVIRTADKIFAELSTNKNTAFFWSGRKNGYGGAERALEIAQGKGGTTLESLLSNKNIDLPEFDFFDNSITEIWNQASEAYAKQASGEVRAVLGNVRPESTWNLFELPALKANLNVTKIIKIDPETLIETVIFTR